MFKLNVLHFLLSSEKEGKISVLEDSNKYFNYVMQQLTKV